MLGLGMSLAAGDTILPGFFLGAQHPSSLHRCSIRSWRPSLLCHASSYPSGATRPSPGYNIIIFQALSILTRRSSSEQLEIMCHILLQEIKIKKEQIFTVKIDDRKDLENVFSLQILQILCSFLSKEQMFTKMNEHNQKLWSIQRQYTWRERKYTWRVRKSSMLI